MNNRTFIGHELVSEGSTCKVLSANRNIIAAEEKNGNVAFYFAPTVKDGKLSAKQKLSYTVTKDEFYETLAEGIGDGISPTDTKALVRYLQLYYYRVYSTLAELIVASYVRESC